MQIQINKLAAEVGSLSATQIANHAENRKDIHRLFNGQQNLVDSVTNGLEKIADKIGDRLSKVETEVVSLKISWARSVGYVMGISAAGAVVFEVVKLILERTVSR